MIGSFITQHYVAIVVALFVFFAFVEVAIPLHRQRERLTFRWFNNFALMIAIVLVFKLAGPIFAVISAEFADYYDIGLFNRIEIGLGASLVAGILILDLKQYLFHRLMHYYDVLWKIHRVHHSDVEIDLTTGFRFHPFEAIFNALIDILVVAVFGIGVEVILLRLILFYFMNLFSHGNFRIPRALDSYLKWILVTPSVHHLHHALEARAANRNFGVIFTFWDRLFGTFLDRHPAMDSDEYDYGLQDYRQGERMNLWVLLKMPFVSVPTQASEDLPRNT